MSVYGRRAAYRRLLARMMILVIPPLEREALYMLLSSRAGRSACREVISADNKPRLARHGKQRRTRFLDKAGFSITAYTALFTLFDAARSVDDG